VELGAPPVLEASRVAWPAVPDALDPWVLRFWLVLSLGTAAVLLRSFFALHRARSRWQHDRIDGRDVLVSQSVGPAVLGVFRPAIVLPRWVTELPRDQRELVLRHEEEHIRAGDLWLLSVSLLSIVLFPWNAALWWQLSRLRTAVEMDCDRRVIRRADLRRYAGLLLDLGQRGNALRLGALALTHSTPLLERRIRTMTTRARPHRALAASLAALSSIVALAAWRLEPPPVPAGATFSLALPQAAAGARDSIEQARSGPAESGSNEAGASGAVSGASARPVAAIPDGLGDNSAEPPPRAIEATVQVRQGTVTGRVTDRSSGAPLGSVQVYLAGDEMGTLTRANGQYTIAGVPAGTYEIRAERIGLTLGRQQITVTEGAPLEVSFELGSQAIGLDEIISNSRVSGPNPPMGDTPPVRPAGPPRRPPETPLFTPATVRPTIANLPEVRDAMAAAYAQMPNGVTFTTEVWIFVSAEGEVQNVKINEAGLPDRPMSVADVLGLPEQVARTMRFTPALNRDQPVAVWVALPLTFRP
jgi:hypothetical protein